MYKTKSMKSINLFLIAIVFSVNSFAQATKIDTKDGIHYITNSIDFPITGIYTFKGTEPVVELNAGATGFYQLHEQPKRAIIWGIECDEAGKPIFIKGFDSAAYALWYQYTTKMEEDTDEDMNWKPVEFTIHFNTQKMFIQGERCKEYK